MHFVLHIVDLCVEDAERIGLVEKFDYLIHPGGVHTYFWHGVGILTRNREFFLVVTHYASRGEFSVRDDRYQTQRSQNTAGSWRMVGYARDTPAVM